MQHKKIIGVIPARYGSTRLRGKPLADICGHPMIWWTYQRVIPLLGSIFDKIIVATDDDRIGYLCENNQIPYIMTKDEHLTAANRLYEVSETIEADFYVQINGDEPLIDTRSIVLAVPDVIPTDREFGTNVITEITNPALVIDSSNIKVVFDANMNTLYMSRTPIPFPFKNVEYTYYKHVGIIGYNKLMLDFYNESVPGRLEKIEGIDTLRFIDYGKELKAIISPYHECLSVDTEKDLDVVRKMIKNHIL